MDLEGEVDRTGSVIGEEEEAISAIVVDSTAVVGSEVVVADFPEMEVESRTRLRQAKTERQEGGSGEVIVDLIEAMKEVLEVDVGDFPDQKEVMMVVALEGVSEVDVGVLIEVVGVLIEVAVVSAVAGVLEAEVLQGPAFKQTPRELV